MYRLIDAALIGAALSMGVLSTPTPGGLLSFKSITFDNFANYSANLNTPTVDLGLYGDPSGELPKTFDLTNNGFIYNPEASYKTFLDTVSGKLTGGKTDIEILAEREATIAKRHLAKRQTQQTITYSLTGGNGQTIDQGMQVCGSDPGADCQSPQNRPYTQITVRQNGNCHFRFWASGQCNGANRRFAPRCGFGEEESNSACQVNGFSTSSFAIFNRCEFDAGSDICA